MCRAGLYVGMLECEPTLSTVLKIPVFLSMFNLILLIRHLNRHQTHSNYRRTHSIRAVNERCYAWVAFMLYDS